MPSLWVRLGVPLIAIGLSIFLVTAAWRAERFLGSSRQRARRVALATAAVLVAWLGLQAALALSGLLGRFDLRPPPMFLWFGSMLALALGVGLSSVGKRLSAGLSMATLVGFQAFRLPLELIMHRAAEEGVMPSVMSYSGYNFDILSGATAIGVAVAVVVGRAPLWLVWVWNVGGLLLLTIVASIAVLASPVVRAFGDEQLNVWVTQFPYVWMAVMVGAALFGHVLLFRKLAALARTNETASQPSPQQRS